MLKNAKFPLFFSLEDGKNVFVHKYSNLLLIALFCVRQADKKTLRSPSKFKVVGFSKKTRIVELISRKNIEEYSMSWEKN